MSFFIWFLNQFSADELYYLKPFPKLFKSLPSCRVIIIDNQSVLWPCDGCIKHLKLRTELSIIIDVLHNDFGITYNLFDVHFIFISVNNALYIKFLRLLLFNFVAVLFGLLDLPFFSWSFSSMLCYGSIILGSINFIDNNLEEFYEIPLLWTFGLREEVKKDHIIELETFGLINSQTKGMLKHGWNFVLALLVPDNNYLITTKF